MRRKDREITDIRQIQKILEKSDVLRVALNNGKYPYIFPVNFGYEINEDKITLYFHTSKEGAKHKIIEKDNRAAFETDCGHMLIPPQGKTVCTASFAYESVIGLGIINKAAEDEKERLLEGLLNHYGIKQKNFDAVYSANTVVYKIDVESYTAKIRRQDG